MTVKKNNISSGYISETLYNFQSQNRFYDVSTNSSIYAI